MPRVRYTDQLDVRNVGPLPLLVPFLKRIGLQGLVDSLVPTTRRARISHGQALCALVLNRLISPRAIYGVEEWSRHTAICEALDISPAELNDDRLLRALDAIVPHIEALQGSLTWQVIERLELLTAFIHWDLTSFVFEGSYKSTSQDDTVPQIGYGSPKKRDAGAPRKQMQVGLATTEDGGVPFWHRSFSGNAAEVSQVADVMEQLKRVVRHSNFTLVGDCKLISERNVLKALQLGICFLGPEPRSEEIACQYRKLRQDHSLRRIDYAPGRAKRKDRRHLYMGFETSFPMTDPKTGNVHTLRRLFIASAEERRATRKSRRRKLTKLYEEIAKVRRNLGRYSLTDPEAVQRRVASLLEKADMETFFRWRVEGQGRQMVLHFDPDRAVFRAERQLDGVYTLLTNLGEKYSIAKLLERYKLQYLSEGRFRDLKGPLHVRPVFLKKNRRVVALVFVVYVALLIYCLIERTARRHLKEHQATLPDPYTGRPLKEPTARRLLSAFEFYFVERRIEQGEIVYVAPLPEPVQAQILELLQIERPLDFLGRG